LLDDREVRVCTFATVSCFSITALITLRWLQRRATQSPCCGAPLMALRLSFDAIIDQDVFFIDPLRAQAPKNIRRGSRLKPIPFLPFPRTAPYATMSTGPFRFLNHHVSFFQVNDLPIRAYRYKMTLSREARGFECDARALTP